MSKPILIIHNQHTDQCGSPRATTKDAPTLYVGYFENAVGEQWIFTYDRQTREATLKGGDSGWQNAMPVQDGQVKRLILDNDEAAWLKACWKAATTNNGAHSEEPSQATAATTSSDKLPLP